MKSHLDDPLLPVAEPDLGALEEQYVVEALRSGWVSSIGPFITRFEAAMAELSGTKHCVAVSNGTVALHLALLARDIGPGDEVIVPDLTFVATAAAVRQTGATPVLVDVDPETLCLDIKLVARAMSPRTKAVIPVHLMGHPADVDALRELTSRRGIFILEDAAEAHGARLRGRRVGGIGDAGCFSFYGNKLVTTGEGGCITTNDDELAARARLLKDHAMSGHRRYYHEVVGYNYRITNLQAALGCAQLERYAGIVEKKNAILTEYRRQLAGTGIKLNPETADTEPVCWLVVARLPGLWNDLRQTELLRTLREAHRIDARPLFVPMHQLPPYRDCAFVHGDAVVSAEAGTSGICLPSSNRLTKTDIARVADALRRTIGASAA